MKNLKIKKFSIDDYLLEVPNFLSIFMFPVVYMLVSPILLEISSSIGTNPEDFNLIFTFFIIGSIVGQLSSIFYTSKLKKSHIIILCYIFMIPIIFYLSIAVNLFIFYVLYFLLGYIVGLIWMKAYENILKSKVKNKDKIIMVALSFYPIGAFVTPFISSTIVNNNLSWRYIYYVVIILIIIIIILYLIIGKKYVNRIEVENDSKKISKKIFNNRNKNITFIVIAITFMFYCISETIISDSKQKSDMISHADDAKRKGAIGDTFVSPAVSHKKGSKPKTAGTKKAPRNSENRF